MPEFIYQFLILKILVSQGGSAETNRVMDIIWRDYKQMLSEKDVMDYEASKELRWKNHVRFARQHLIDGSCLANNSPHGIWEITEKGRQQYAKWTDELREGVHKEESSKKNNDKEAG